MREVVISDAVLEKIGELEIFLKEGLKMSKEAAFKRCNRMDDFFESLKGRVDYPLCPTQGNAVLQYIIDIQFIATLKNILKDELGTEFCWPKEKKSKYKMAFTPYRRLCLPKI